MRSFFLCCGPEPRGVRGVLKVKLFLGGSLTSNSGLNIQAGWYFWSPLWYTSALHTFWVKCLPDSPVPLSFSPNFRQKENIWLSLRSRLPSFTWNNRLREAARSVSPLPASPYRNQAFHKRRPCVAIWTQEHKIAVIYVEWIKKKKRKSSACVGERVSAELCDTVWHIVSKISTDNCSRSGLRGTHAVLAESTYNCTLEITTHPRVCAQERQRSCHLSACRREPGRGNPVLWWLEMRPAAALSPHVWPEHRRDEEPGGLGHGHRVHV